jgi:hypothetical protein
MMKVSVIPGSPAYLGNRLFTDRSVRDDLLAPYREIRKAVEGRGGTMATFDQLPFHKADRVLAFNFAAFPEAVLSALDTVGKANMIAIVREPPGIDPLYYDRDIQECFGRFYVPAKDGAGTGNVFYLEFPVSPVPAPWAPFESKRLLVSITSGKFASFEGSLYEERVRATKYFQKAIPEQFDMYGQGWRQDTFLPWFSPHRLFPCYKGPVISKHETMRHYRFSLCYENTGNVRGYVSEKVLDSLRCGCVPIYLGAPDIEEYVPPACFVDRRVFASDREVASFIQGMDRKTYNGYLDEIRVYLDSEAYGERLPKPYAQKVLTTLKQPAPVEPASPPMRGRAKLHLLAAMKAMGEGGPGKRIRGSLRFAGCAGLGNWIGLFRRGLLFMMQGTGLQGLTTWVRLRRI